MSSAPVTQRSRKITEACVGVVALVLSLGFGIAASGGMSSADAAPVTAVVGEDSRDMICPEDATGFPTAVDPTCVSLSTGELVDALQP